MGQKPYRPTGPQNLLWRCTDCGACFRGMTQRAKMDNHCSVMYAGYCRGQAGYLHHGYQASTLRNQPHIAKLSRYPHEAMAEFRRYMEELDNEPVI